MKMGRGKLYSIADKHIGEAGSYFPSDVDIALIDEAKRELNDILDAPILRNGAPSVGKRVYAWSLNWFGDEE